MSTDEHERSGDNRVRGLAAAVVVLVLLTAALTVYAALAHRAETDPAPELRPAVRLL